MTTLYERRKAKQQQKEDKPTPLQKFAQDDAEKSSEGKMGEDSSAEIPDHSSNNDEEPKIDMSGF